ncbi:MAG: penicillin-binding transpeptidase domain-containing protein, partial [Planctomycetia bacterium]|nr:penicillin-binding transpeptidase domain-containing protein [Planctomycetia bacterium]
RATLGPPADGAQEDRDDEEKPIRAAAVVIDVATGEILVLASTPRYDLNTFGARYSEMLEDESRPMVHRAIAGQYPAGSVFKAVTATAALHLNAISAATLLTCQGCLDTSKPNEWRCFRHMSHGAIALREAIKRSCNVYFYRLGRTIGAEDLERWSHKLGFGQKTGVELPGEAGGHVPGDPYSGGRDWRDPRNLAVGQGTLLVTPLQVAQLYGIIATGGRMRRPHIVLSPRSRRPKRMNVGLKPGHMALLRDAFAAVVNEPGGTGFRHVRVRNVMIAGKTGTAESGRGRETHAWFAGFAPAGNPRIAFAVIVEHGGLGGSVAGPVAREIVLRTMAHGYLNGTRLAEGRGLR